MSCDVKVDGYDHVLCSRSPFVCCQGLNRSGSCAARALIPDDDDEELIEKAKANRKSRLAAEKTAEKEYAKSGGFADGEVVAVQIAVNKLARSGEALAAGDLPAVAATVGYVFNFRGIFHTSFSLSLQYLGRAGLDDTKLQHMSFVWLGKFWVAVYCCSAAVALCHLLQSYVFPWGLLFCRLCGWLLTKLFCSFSSDAWVGEFQKATSGLSTSDAAKKSASAVFEVCVPCQPSVHAGNKVAVETGIVLHQILTPSVQSNLRLFCMF